MEQEKDQALWRIAQKRAAFRKSLYTYSIMMIFFWAIWWFTTGKITGLKGWPWPLWIMLGWGIGIAFQYFGAYQGSKSDLAEEEYQKLKRKHEL